MIPDSDHRQWLVADYANPDHAADLIMLLDCYARDPAATSEPLPEFTRQHLTHKLSKIPSAFSILAYIDGMPAGLANCFWGFSTFKCRPLVNIHDFVVHPDFRGRRLAHFMLAAIEEVARDKGCCKITLEVLEHNEPAKAAYRKFGFTGYELEPSMGAALFWEKELHP